MESFFKTFLPIKWAIFISFVVLSVESRFLCLSELISAPRQLYFQNPGTPVMEGLICFHDKAMLLVTFIVFSVGFVLFRCVTLFESKPDGRRPDRFIHSTLIEVVWTVLPALMLLNLAVPSFSLLYSIDELPGSQGTLKCIGHQWYWAYEYSEYSAGRELPVNCIEDSFPKEAVFQEDVKPSQSWEFTGITSESMCFFEMENNLLVLTGYPGFNSMSLKELIEGKGLLDFRKHIVSGNTGESSVIGYSTESYLVDDSVGVGKEFYRLLSVDNSAKIPVKKHIRILITSADVLHSWAVPSLGIKVDACPGRLNQASTYLNRIGKHYGQCSELCGVNHGFMPIVVESVSM
jgi:heme/copper-type cytochrome/quinol oxidase subunit 2